MIINLSPLLPFSYGLLFGVGNALLFAPPMIASFFARPSLGSAALFGLTTGVSVFGCGYIAIHDGLHHGRFGGVEWLRRFPSVAEIASAHAVHHTKASSPPYGLFLGPSELRAHARGEKPAGMPRTLGVVLAVACACAVAGWDTHV